MQTPIADETAAIENISQIIFSIDKESMRRVLEWATSVNNSRKSESPTNTTENQQGDK